MLIKLMKYDLMRKKNILLTSTAMFVLIELLLVFSLYKGNTWLIVFWIGSTILFAGTLIFVLYDNIKLLSDDLNTKSGYMLFLTPNHGYNIIGSKMIVGFIEAIIATVFLIIAFYINYTYANSLANGEFALFIKEIIEGFASEIRSVGITNFHLVSMIFGGVLEWFSFIATVYLAIILRKTLFSATKFKGFLSFIVFIALNIVISTVEQIAATGVMALLGYGDLITNPGVVEPSRIIGFVNLMIGLSNGINTAIIIGFFVACGYLLTKKIDL